MSKSKKNSNQAQKVVPINVAPNKPENSGKSEPVIILYPLLWLVLVVIVMYFRTLKMGVTELDDTIFIRDFQNYNEHLTNLITSFQRGLFDAVKDPYYRPLFLDSMVLNYWISGHGQNILMYHLVNILFHVISVLLLYKLFIKLQILELHAFILAIIFAIHPVLTQAVAWIPGRNDTLLAIFVLSFLNFAITYTKTGKIENLAFSGLFLLLAYFTKETAVFAAPVAFVMLVIMLGTKIFEKRIILQYCLWLVCFLIWFFVRSVATIESTNFSAHMLSDFVYRLPLIMQYIGKIFIPVNLSVFPMQEETVYYFGIIAMFFLVGIIYFSPKRNWKQIIGGICVFLLFLIPALILPSNLNEQTFEHRLYLPIIGILLIIPQTFLMKGNFSEGQLVIFSFIIICLLAGTTFNHQSNFSDPLVFWENAVETSPKSAFANMHLAEYVDNLDKKCNLIRKAYQINPKEKYINFFYAEMLINSGKKDSVLAAEPYLFVENGISRFYKCEFYLARISVEKNDLNAAIYHLQQFLKTEPENSKEGGEANNNLLLLYLNTKQTNKVIYQAKHMKELGLPVPDEILKTYRL